MSLFIYIGTIIYTTDYNYLDTITLIYCSIILILFIVDKKRFRFYTYFILFYLGTVGSYIDYNKLLKIDK